MLLFFAAFACVWYSSFDRVVIIAISIAVLAFVLVLIWTMSATYEKEPYVTYGDKAKQKVEGVEQVVKKATRAATMKINSIFGNPGLAPFDIETAGGSNSEALEGSMLRQGQRPKSWLSSSWTKKEGLEGTVDNYGGGDTQNMDSPSEEKFSPSR